ncbi:hypothetical protein MPH_00877 [Macrophomina phaseolina MS6]|uniref:Uncharacterized protein n=2 Tax=Macrophomina phaseolina TaxID=35725 RepID=K2RHB8_MACPH|nr:hypothetical protein MPH_00877 [Macrophomina phaseolina MS6]
MCSRCATTFTKACQALRPSTKVAAPRISISQQAARSIHNSPFKPYNGHPMTVAQAVKHNKAGMAGVGSVCGALLLATGIARLAHGVEERSYVGGRDRNGVQAYLARKNGLVVV